MITTGVTGRPWRASISEWGSIEPWDATPPLNWFVAADDRWHVPAEETAVRQRRVDGTPVTETRVRVPSGDIVQRIHSTADGGGLTIVEVENESTMPAAIAFDRRDVLTERPVVDVPIEGIDLPDQAFVTPIAHTAAIRVAIVHGEQRSGPLPGGVASSMQVVRGWTTLTDRASRFVLPDGELGAGLAEMVVAERCEVALGSIPRASDDAAGYVLALGELVRLGEPSEHWLAELVEAVELLGPDPSWDATVALRVADQVLTAAGERRARRDLARIVAERSPVELPERPPADVRAVAWLESSLATAGTLLPAGLPAEWLGQSFEAYGLPTGPRSAVSYALRWHGERPAIIWEQTGDPIELTAPIVAPDWRSSESTGEALWPPPTVAVGDEPPSFS